MTVVLSRAALVFAVLMLVRQGPPGEHASLRLHYVQKPIGVERYDVVRDGGRLRLSSAFEFTDRGGRVELEATLETAADLTPVSFRAKGKSYRFVNVDSEVHVEGGSALVRACARAFPE